MEYICPYCGSEEKGTKYCTACLNKTDWVEEIWHKSQAYYIKGYDMAKSRNLSLSIKYLVKATTLNKYNIEARNLLGLVYFEIGQVGKALKEWVISQSLKRKDNIAKDYLEKVQKSPKTLASYREAIGLYNKALAYLKQQNMDMAIIRLRKAVNIHPHFIEARSLLALAYMREKQFHKASEQIKKLLIVDHAHEKGLLYYKMLSDEDTEHVNPYEKFYENKVDPTTEKIGKIIDRNTLFFRYFTYFLIGAVGMFLIQRYLIIPSKMNSYQSEHIRLKDSENVLSNKLQELTKEYQLKVAKLEGEKKKADEQLASYETQVSEMTQKDQLTTASGLIDEGKYVEAAQLIYGIASTQLDEKTKEQYEQLKKTAYEKAVDTIYAESINLYEQGSFQEAKAKLEIVLHYEPSERMARKAIYQLGCISQNDHDLSEAKRYFSKVTSEYPNTTEAGNAKRQLDEMISN